VAVSNNRNAHNERNTIQSSTEWKLLYKKQNITEHQVNENGK